MQSAAENQCGGGDPVGDRQRDVPRPPAGLGRVSDGWIALTRRSPCVMVNLRGLEERSAQREERGHERGGPEAAAPPKATADILRTPVPCSLTDQRIPVPIIAEVVTA